MAFYKRLVPVTLAKLPDSVLYAASVSSPFLQAYRITRDGIGVKSNQAVSGFTGQPRRVRRSLDRNFLYMTSTVGNTYAFKPIDLFAGTPSVFSAFNITDVDFLPQTTNVVTAASGITAGPFDNGFTSGFSYFPRRCTYDTTTGALTAIANPAGYERSGDPSFPPYNYDPSAKPGIDIGQDRDNYDAFVAAYGSEKAAPRDGFTVSALGANSAFHSGQNTFQTTQPQFFTNIGDGQGRFILGRTDWNGSRLQVLRHTPTGSELVWRTLNDTPEASIIALSSKLNAAGTLLAVGHFTGAVVYSINLGTVSSITSFRSSWVPIYDIAWNKDGQVAFATNTAPRIATYNPSNLFAPQTADLTGIGVVKSLVYSEEHDMLIAGHDASPFIAAFRWIGSTLTRLPDPASAAGGEVVGLALI